MANLKRETLAFLEEHGKTKDDILWVGCPEYTIPTELFWKLADKWYDDGYGSPEVADDLLIVGEDFWLERHEYDGSEWWEFKTMPKKPDQEREVKKVIKDDWYWGSLTSINQED